MMWRNTKKKTTAEYVWLQKLMLAESLNFRLPSLHQIIDYEREKIWNNSFTQPKKFLFYLDLSILPFCHKWITAESFRKLIYSSFFSFQIQRSFSRNLQCTKYTLILWSFALGYFFQTVDINLLTTHGLSLLLRDVSVFCPGQDCRSDEFQNVKYSAFER